MLSAGALPSLLQREGRLNKGSSQQSQCSKLDRPFVSCLKQLRMMKLATVAACSERDKLVQSKMLLAGD